MKLAKKPANMACRLAAAACAPCNSSSSRRKLAKDAPIPCIVRTGGFVEADSLAENVEREALHPLDQFGAFKALADQGQGEETIAAAFRVTPAVVKQRLRLAKASPVLLNSL